MADSLDPAPEEPEAEAWTVVATVPSAQLARELAALCREARVPVRIRPAGAPFSATVEPAALHVVEHLALAVWVPERELPVAAGVADRLLAWFRGEAEGPATPDEIAAGLQDPDDELRDALAREREATARREADLMRLGMLAGLFVVALLITAVWTTCSAR